MVSAQMFSGIGWQHDLLGWVFTYLIHSTVLIIGVWALTRALPRLSLDTRETMWRVALFGGLLTSLVQCGLGLTPVPGNFDMPDAMVARASTDAPATTAPTAGAEEIVDKRVVEHRSGELTITTVRERKAAAASAVPLQASTWPWVILGLVGLGSLFAVTRLVLAGRALAKQLQGRRDVIEDPVLETHLALCAKAELKKRPRLSASSKLRSPVALWRNEICLPERAVDALSPQQQQGMLAHELAHLLRGDPLWRIGTAAFEAILFFQPLNHFARRHLNEIAEFQCDDWAAEHTGTGVHLAKCLAEVASWLDGGPPQSAIVTAMAGPNSPIVQRITRLLGHTKASAAGHTGVRVAFTVFALGAVAWFVPGVGYARPSVPTATASQGEAEGVRFVDASDARFDRSTVHVDSGDERVEVRVEAPKYAPPPAVEAPMLPRRDDGGGLQIIIQGGIWGGSHFPFCTGPCGGGLFLDLEWLDGLDGLEALIEGEIDEELHGVFGAHYRRGSEGRERERVERAHERAERAQDRARRSLERAERMRQRAVDPDRDRQTQGWFGLLGADESRADESHGAGATIVEL